MTRIPRVLAVALMPLSVAYGWVVGMKNWMYDAGWLKAKRLKGAVISVGNLTTGGTGKTPMVLWLAERFLAEGKSVAILSRGYEGSGGTSDEVELMRGRLGDRVRFGVGANRFASGVRLEAERRVDVFLLDDGFQHRRLERDLDILMLDGSRDLRGGWMLPSGSLREPVSACHRADVLVVSRKSERVPIEAADAKMDRIFYAQTRLLGFRRLGVAGVEPKGVSEIGGGPFFAFCGIGNPDAFFSDLVGWGLELAGEKAFRDHHAYSGTDVERLDVEADQGSAAGFVTTEKDAANLALAGRGFRRAVWVAVIDFVLSSESEFVAVVERALREKRGAAA
ncbi:MAG TPA: tetraacyldisaccharide 4'-kinase [Candidatus Sulfotelmatobacter sp.]|nr:tetraacyldisaccharide 4'-kinase [Candidatus Sulfotelmatobacter sp.]